ncbi:integrase catalytic region [Sinorhizobium meliloti CCNWSX0020]|uniref:Integrase catalytic region n=1 Tax=Sinorhizobium meliloti CCNWSX0020 TaxID=1107881 RepID=H0FSX4_RHIML|nr:integrase catalytic region [Sinorhizobium meliloti CCNWSX0020]
MLNIVDDVTRECLAAIPDASISGRRVARELRVLLERRGKPGMIVSDHGTETPRTRSCLVEGAMQTRYVESFNGRMRDEPTSC